MQQDHPLDLFPIWKLIPQSEKHLFTIEFIGGQAHQLIYRQRTRGRHVIVQDWKDTTTWKAPPSAIRGLRFLLHLGEHQHRALSTFVVVVTISLLLFDYVSRIYWSDRSAAPEALMRLKSWWESCKQPLYESKCKCYFGYVDWSCQKKW